MDKKNMDNQMETGIIQGPMALGGRRLLYIGVK